MPYPNENLGYLSQNFTSEREKSEVAGTFNSACHLTLMFCTGTGLAAWTNLTTVGYITPQQVSLLVVNLHAVIGAELANTRLAKKSFATTMHISHCFICIHRNLLLEDGE
jgi:hypothetical protein